MAAFIAVLITVSVSLIITRVGTAALVHTGLSREVARFQARSAFFGVGFTTSEAESVVNHPVRRRIVLWLVVLGNAGIVTVLASVILSVTRSHGVSAAELAFLAVGLAALALLGRSRLLERIIDRALDRWTDLDVRDYADLLELTGDFAVAELRVEPGDWLAEETLRDLHLRDEGVVVLGITRANGNWLGAPDGDTVVHAGDTLVVYGRDDRVCELDERRDDATGDAAHAVAVAEQERLEAAEEELDAAPAG
ncbi:MAG: potassium transporter TrkA [Actinobacteria bacterium]|nr:MAG: potassium transporter TrkA [Actinomycetota bacterium]